MDAKIYSLLPSPTGPLVLAGDGSALSEIFFQNGRTLFHLPSTWRHDPSCYQRAVQQLEEYFGGRRREFDIEIHPQGTPFQLRVWSELRRIPYGETISYKQLAERIGDAAATRAVGAANGRNPLPIVAPCHRVIGSNGSLTGFGGGLENKKWLLEMEARHTGQRFDFK